MSLFSGKTTLQRCKNTKCILQNMKCGDYKDKKNRIYFYYYSCFNYLCRLIKQQSYTKKKP